MGVNSRKLEHHLYHAYTTDVSASDILVHTKNNCLDLLPSNIDLVAAELELVDMSARELQLKILLKDIADNYDYIFVDCPPSLGLLTINALTAAHAVLIPMQCEYFAMEGLAQLINTIRAVKKSFNKNLFIEGLILTMFDTRNKLTHQVSDELGKHFKQQLLKTTIPRNVRLSECPSHGVSIFDYDPKSSGAIAYNKLANEFLRNQR